MINQSFSLILIASTLIAKDSYSNDTKVTLPELSIQGSSMLDLDLSRESILSGDTIESNKISSISNLSGSLPNFYINSNGQQSYGDVITLRGIGNAQLLATLL